MKPSPGKNTEVLWTVRWVSSGKQNFSSTITTLLFIFFTLGIARFATPHKKKKNFGRNSQVSSGRCQLKGHGDELWVYCGPFLLATVKVQDIINYSILVFFFLTVLLV